MIVQQLQEIWVYLAASPLLALTMTLVAFQAADLLYQRAGRLALLNPVLVSVAMIVAVLALTGTPYATYFEGAQFVHFLLGPATVALAVPLYRQFDRIRASWKAILASILTGALASIAVTLMLGRLLGASSETLASLAPKSVTAPVAMGIAEAIGGAPSLAAAMVVTTGILGAALGPALLSAIGVRDDAARGVALGTASHGIGTARALQESEAAGAFSGLAMGINAVATAILLPLVWRFLF
ncbi:LrgB family protein [Aureimonas mangrovi]|uniref:LrgB family protein n=1 Tax=Aureimonas mangrovi TaxID=2758041 RepID=UPI00163D51DB|nr:LrgB family protein [Aureimonas mangrovi]